jgi:hypothetical protein
LRRSTAQVTAGRGIGSANCATRWNEFRSLQHTDTIAGRCNLCVTHHLRPRIAVERASANPPKWEQGLMGIGDTADRKKYFWDSMLPRPPGLRVLRENGPQWRSNPRESGTNTTQRWAVPVLQLNQQNMMSVA